MSVIQSMASAAQQLFGNTTIESLQHSWLSFATDEKSVRVIYMLLMLVVMLAGLIRMAKTTSFSRGWKIGLQCTVSLLLSIREGTSWGLRRIS